MNVKLNKRLSTISAFINDNENIIDIGCDHGLLGIYLYQNRINVKIISSDINKNPLLICKNNLIKYKIENKIELRLGNGLKCLDNDTNAVVISGMGGINIANILKDIKKYSNVKKLIISPNNDFVLTRKSISKLGFYLENEKIIFENNKYYLISVYTKIKTKYNYFFGRLDVTENIVKEYYKDIYNKNKLILKQLPRNKILKKIKLIIINKKIKSTFF